MRSVHIIEQMIYIYIIYISKCLSIILITRHVFTTGSTIIHQVSRAAAKSKRKSSVSFGVPATVAIETGNRKYFLLDWSRKLVPYWSVWMSCATSDISIEAQVFVGHMYISKRKCYPICETNRAEALCLLLL